MIVYSGKQYGNDFNNGDEALFQDANRPRDNDKFKIRPGLQSDKRKQREVNKNIITRGSQLSGYGQTTTKFNSANDYFIPQLEKQTKTGNPGCIINDDGNIEIVEDGTYILQASCQFQYSSDPGNSITEVVYLLKLVDGAWNKRSMSQGRACTRNDLQVATYYSWLNKGSVFNVGAWHSSANNIYLFAVMNILRLA